MKLLQCSIQHEPTRPFAALPPVRNEQGIPLQEPQTQGLLVAAPPQSSKFSQVVLVQEAMGEARIESRL